MVLQGVLYNSVDQEFGKIPYKTSEENQEITVYSGSGYVEIDNDRHGIPGTLIFTEAYDERTVEVKVGKNESGADKITIAEEHPGEKGERQKASISYEGRFINGANVQMIDGPTRMRFRSEREI